MSGKKLLREYQPNIIKILDDEEKGKGNLTEEEKEDKITALYTHAKKAGLKGNLIAFKKSLLSPSKEDQKPYLKALNIGYRKPLETFRKEVLRKTDENES